MATTRWARQREGRLLAGVAAGLARAWRLDPALVRFGFLALTLAGGLGALVYLALWALLPAGDDTPAPRVASDPRDALAAIAVVAGALLVCRQSGLWFTDTVFAVGLVAVVGIALVWGRADSPADVAHEKRSAVRIASGVVLLGVGFVVLLARLGDLELLAQSLVAAIVAATGVVLLASPRLVRLVDDLAAERRARVRVEERAEIAAHLHDSVLQTLALIQKRADDPREVASLARRQERELREWLYGSPTRADATLAGALAAEVAAVEDDHQVRVELVCVGDAPLDDEARALVAATREAALNAARHAGVGKVDVYVEVEDDELVAFVRDRGKGFDREAVGADRLGLAESIEGRVRRAGGTAAVRTGEGEGTEVSLRVPRRSG